MPTEIIEHVTLGQLRYEKLLKGYVGEIELSDMPFKINLVTEKREELEQLATELIDFLMSENFSGLLIKSLERLLVIKNSDWLNDNEAEYTLEELCDFVSLDAVVIYPNKIELYTDDLELLWRNRAIFTYNKSYQIISVEIDESSTE